MSVQSSLFDLASKKSFTSVIRKEINLNFKPVREFLKKPNVPQIRKVAGLVTFLNAQQCLLILAFIIRQYIPTNTQLILDLDSFIKDRK